MEIGNKLNQYKLLKNNALKQARASKKSALIAVCNSKKRLRKLTMSTSVVEELKKELSLKNGDIHKLSMTLSNAKGYKSSTDY